MEHSQNQSQQTERIRALNDQYRQALPIVPGLAITSGIQAAFDDDLTAVFDAVRDFSDFCEDNDPYGEHDFGEIQMGSHAIYWKFDYYDTDLAYRSPDPSDPERTRRVLTIMLREEY